MRIYLAFTLALWLVIQSLIATTSKGTVPETAASQIAMAAETASFRFVNWGDAQDESGNLSNTAAQAASLNPAFTLFNGDLEDAGVVSNQMDSMTNSFGSLYAETFLVRGNHDDTVSGSAGLWENYFTAVNRSLPAGVTNYVGLNSSSTYLTYSFDYGNSRFIGMDVPGDADLLTSSQLTFLDNRLADAENNGLTHAFIYFHGPEYCVESTHCNCTSANDGSCTPSAFVNIINKHPIVSATFHGHEHILGWVHMDNSRVAGLTQGYEEFLTSPSGGWTYNDYVYPARMDYYYANMGSSQGFAAIDVNGASFTVNFYKVGTTAPVWSRTFTKSGGMPTETPADKVTTTPTSTFTKTFTTTTGGAATSTRTQRPTRTSTKTATITRTRTASSTGGSTKTFSPTPTKTYTLVATRKSPPVGGYAIFLPVISRNPHLVGATPIPTHTATFTNTHVSTRTFTAAATYTPSRTFTKTATHDASWTSTSTPTKTYTPTTTLTRAATATRTSTSISTETRTPTLTRTPTKTATPAATITKGSGVRPLKYYMVDRVLNNADYAKLAGWGINTAVVNISTNGTTAQWQAVYNAASAAGVSIVVWPNIGQDNNCGWELPFNNPVNGSYIESSKNLLNFWKDKAIGIVTFHEPMWTTSAGCKDSMADLSQIYAQIYDYTGNPNFKVWGYINTLNTSTIKNGDGGGTGVADYTGPADLSKILDVAVIWQHCAGGVEGPCEGSYSALSRINEARTLLNSVNSPVASVYIMQTFTSGGYDTKFTLSQLENYSCEFLNTNALDGFGYYTWDAGWWPDLHSWTDLQPAVPYIYNTCTNPAP